METTLYCLPHVFSFKTQKICIPQTKSNLGSVLNKRGKVAGLLTYGWGELAPPLEEDCLSSWCGAGVHLSSAVRLLILKVAAAHVRCWCREVCSFCCWFFQLQLLELSQPCVYLTRRDELTERKVVTLFHMQVATTTEDSLAYFSTFKVLFQQQLWFEAITSKHGC